MTATDDAVSVARLVPVAGLLVLLAVVSAIATFARGSLTIVLYSGVYVGGMALFWLALWWVISRRSSTE